MSLFNYEDSSDDTDFFDPKSIYNYYFTNFNQFNNLNYLLLLDELSRQIFSTSNSENNAIVDTISNT